MPPEPPLPTNPSIQAAASAGAVLGREGEAHEPGGAVVGQPPVVEQEPCGAPTDATGEAVPPGEDAEDGGPALPDAGGGVGFGFIAGSVAGFGFGQEADGLMHGVRVAAHLRGGVGVEARAGGREADEDALGDARRHLGEGSGAGAADVAVAHGAHQGGQGPGQVADIGVQGGAVGEGAHDGGQGAVEPGEQAALGQGGDVGERIGFAGQRLGPGGGGALHGGAPRTRFGDPHRQLGLPAQPPALPEGAEPPARAHRLAPVDAEQPQPVQQPAAGGVGVLAQVELAVTEGGFGLEAQGALKPGEVALQRRGRGGCGDLAEDIADDEPVPYEGERHVGAVAHHGADGVDGLGEPGQRAAAHGGQGLGEADGLDDVGGGDGEVLLAQQAGDVGQPALDGPVGGVEEMPVPAGRGDPGAVTAVPGEPAVGPGHPADLGLDLGQALEHLTVGGDGPLGGEG
ncbi:hypothetical protein GCM10020000_32160 [Streptomyces olivoverticillatus]